MERQDVDQDILTPRALRLITQLRGQYRCLAAVVSCAGGPAIRCALALEEDEVDSRVLTGRGDVAQYLADVRVAVEEMLDAALLREKVMDEVSDGRGLIPLGRRL